VITYLSTWYSHIQLGISILNMGILTMVVSGTDHQATIGFYSVNQHRQYGSELLTV
jgi:hypothetical protein